MKIKIKQILSVAIVFVLLGGCAGVQKNSPPEMQFSTYVWTESTEETVTLAESTILLPESETTANPTTELTKEIETTKAKTTAKSTTSKSTTSAKTTTEKVTTTQKPTTTKAQTTAPTETTTVTTTEEATTQEMNTEGVIIGLKSLRFGCGMQEITDAFGSPSETINEELIEGGTVNNLVYAANYSEFKVFQLLNGRFFGFYTCDKNTIVTDGEASYSLRAGGKTEFGKIKITEYEDSKKGNDVYAFKACFNGFGFYPHELKSLGGQERLIFYTTNAVRAINRLYPLEYSATASDCVREHCADMSEKDYFSHDSKNGMTSAQRMKKSGIDYTICGENLAAGYEDAFGMVDGWYNSSGHRKNLLDSEFLYLGVGVVYGNESYNIYAGQSYYR